MSATNRKGLARQPHDFYETPTWAIEAILDELRLNSETDGVIVDAGAGTGAIAERVAYRCPKADLYLVELQQELAGRAIARNIPTANVVVEDFRKWVAPAGVTHVIMNPPYCHAETFVRRALELVGSKGTVVALLRLGFLAAQCRRALHTDHPSTVYVLPRRPSFNGSGTDATDYGWFVWGPRHGGKWRLLGPSLRPLDVPAHPTEQ